MLDSLIMRRHQTWWSLMECGTIKFTLLHRQNRYFTRQDPGENKASQIMQEAQGKTRFDNCGCGQVHSRSKRKALYKYVQCITRRGILYRVCSHLVVLSRGFTLMIQFRIIITTWDLPLEGFRRIFRHKSRSSIKILE